MSFILNTQTVGFSQTLVNAKQTTRCFEFYRGHLQHIHTLLQFIVQRICLLPTPLYTEEFVSLLLHAQQIKILLSN
jgi:hypothetical protein